MTTLDAKRTSDLAVQPTLLGPQRGLPFAHELLGVLLGYQELKHGLRAAVPPPVNRKLPEALCLAQASLAAL
jgi:hypothetical protein